MTTEYISIHIAHRDVVTLTSRDSSGFSEADEGHNSITALATDSVDCAIFSPGHPAKPPAP
jgi:hypothetical protein